MIYHEEDKECRMEECHDGKVWRDDTLKGCACPTNNVWDPEGNTCH